MIEIQCAQGSDEWHNARLGIPTASCFDKIITPTGKKSGQRDAYLCELLAEWKLGYGDELPDTYWIERGKALEPEARAFYEFQTGAEVRQVGFVYKDERKLIGCSPDWLIGDDGCGEVKCPKASTHVRYILGGTVAAQYKPQTQGQLWVTGRKWVDFTSYHPELPPLIVRVERDEKFQALLDQELGTFLDALVEGREKLMEATK